MSILLKGNESLAMSLRLLTSIELYKNTEYYAKHPRLDDENLFVNQNNAFCALLSDESSRHFKGERRGCILIEANLNLRNRNWSSMICMMALSSVIKRDVKSIYPECDNRKVKSLLDCIVKPRIAVQANDPLRILWSRVGGLNEGHMLDLFQTILHQF